MRTCPACKRYEATGIWGSNHVNHAEMLPRFGTPRTRPVTPATGNAR